MVADNPRTPPPAMPEKNPLKRADVVRLKKVGGPKMIVGAAHGSGMVDVAWFDKADHLQTFNLHCSLLEKARP